MSAWRGPTGQLLARTSSAGSPETKFEPSLHPAGERIISRIAFRLDAYEARQSRPREAADQAAAQEFLACHNSLRVARLGQLARPLDHPAFVAETAGGRLPGMLTYVPGQDWQQCEILTLHAGEQWHGAGTALIEAIWHLATRQGCTRGAPACGSLPPTTTLMRCVSTSAAASAW